VRPSRSFGKYRLLEPVASGGMAEVWRAEAPGAEGFVKEVALKLIRGDHDARGDFVRMFIQEARLASRLSHANIVQVFDFDQVEGQYYIAMEMVRGRTLREVVDRCREQGVRLGLARAVHVCAEVARALAYAHRLEEGGRPAGLVHRDVSPQNVLLSFEGEVKLTDFGIARALGASELTAPGTLKGKIAYMAPEQARSEPVDARADVFAVGVMLWELCTGRRLFARDTEAATLAAVLGADEPSPPSAWNEAVPPRLDQAVLAALARDPARRTPSAEALSAELGALRRELATGDEDMELRDLMRRLWPDGGASSRSLDGEAAVPRAAEPTVRRAGEATVRREVETGEVDPDAPTKTVRRAPAGGARRGRRGAAVLVGAGLVAVVVGLVGWGGAGTRRASTAAEIATGTRTEAKAETETETKTRTGTGTAAATQTEKTASAPATRTETTTPTPTPTPTGTKPATRTEPETRPPSPSRTERRPARTEPLQAAATPADVATVPAPPGRATLTVHVWPWGFVTIDGGEPIEAPFESRPLPAGRHVLRVRNEAGEETLEVTLTPGRHFVWRPQPGKK
jgi:serine/threonine-protein kinase